MLPLLVAERGVGKEQHSTDASSSVVATVLAMTRLERELSGPNEVFAPDGADFPHYP
jgi:hypothetical protein